MGAVSLQDLGHLARGVDVELALEDVVNDGLAEVIHNVSIPVLQGQSGAWGERKGSEPIWVGQVPLQLERLAGDTPLPTL